MSDNCQIAEKHALKALDQLARLSKMSARTVAQNRLIEVDRQTVLYCIDLLKKSSAHWQRRFESESRRLKTCQTSLSELSEGSRE